MARTKQTARRSSKPVENTPVVGGKKNPEKEEPEAAAKDSDKGDDSYADSPNSPSSSASLSPSSVIESPVAPVVDEDEEDADLPLASPTSPKRGVKRVRSNDDSTAGRETKRRLMINKASHHMDKLVDVVAEFFPLTPQRERQIEDLINNARYQLFTAISDDVLGLIEEESY